MSVSTVERPTATPKAPVATEGQRYLPFVDGLRAISILAVVGFHTGVPGLSGGYVGVDVFFVISGFLIINQIRADLEANRFSILSFYCRRALRILPPYIIVLLAAFLLALLILPTPDVYIDFVGTAVASPLMLSNIFFFLKQGYFDLDANEKPLLHTWTLSVEEQFYFLAPVLLMLVFHLGRRRFGGTALAVGIALCAVSLAGAVVETHATGRNPAFYLPIWRMWEFVAGGLVSGSLVAAVGRAPRAVAEVMGWVGLAGIVLAVTTFNVGMPYPSWRAVLPVAGAVLVIVSGLAQPRGSVARLLTLRWLVAIGLVSYGWYLWHWPLLSFLRISRLGDASLPADLLVGGLLAFVLACASYVYVERPLRRWRASRGGIARPGRVVGIGVAACIGTAVVGGLASLAGYLSAESFAVSHYGIDGNGVLENGCHVVTSSTLPDSCLDGKIGLLLGDSRADAISGSFTRRLDQDGIRLITLARGGCDPLRFGPLQRTTGRQHDCANLLGPFEQLIASPKVPSFVIVTSAWWGTGEQISRLLEDFLSQFDPARTRVLVIGPVPTFAKSSLDCIVLSDRYGGNRERCTAPRATVEARLASTRDALKAASAGFGNVRYADPVDLFCDGEICRPFVGDKVLYIDDSHVSPAGADRIYDGFPADMDWLTARGSAK